MTMRSAYFLTALFACSGGTASAPSSGSSGADLDTDGLGKSHVTPAAKKPDAPIAAGSAKPTAPAPTASVSLGLSFRDDVLLLYRMAACGGDADKRIPESLGDAIKRDKLAKVVERHCSYLLGQIGKFRTAYFEKHKSWFDEHVPKDTKTVVYSFGGGDLLSAMVAFPDATEITTISLELSGDPRRIRKIAPDQLGNSLAALRVEIGGLLQVGSNTSVNLSSGQRNELPGQVSSHLMGMVAAGFEPTDMRYFRLDDGGAIQYLEQGDIDEADKKRLKKQLKGDWASPNFSEAFSNVEITYKRPGETTTRTFRHIGWNLGDEYLKDHPQLTKHLAAKGKTVMMVKGASYLLHRPTFAVFRTFLLQHMSWMLSDSTGIPPIYAEPAGMVQETFGSYSGALLEGSRYSKADKSFVELWRKNPRQKLGFRFGYVDASGAGHLVITKPK
jgi:hypothetical protein